MQVFFTSQHYGRLRVSLNFYLSLQERVRQSRTNRSVMIQMQHIVLVTRKRVAAALQMRLKAAPTLLVDLVVHFMTC